MPIHTEQYQSHELCTLRPALPPFAESRKKSDDDKDAGDDVCGRGIAPELIQDYTCTVRVGTHLQPVHLITKDIPSSITFHHFPQCTCSAMDTCNTISALHLTKITIVLLAKPMLKSHPKLNTII